MLMAFCSLDKEGEFSVNGDLRVLYTTMMSIRNLIIIGAGQQTMLPIKLGLRYALVRRQFSTIKGQKIERPIFDYQTHLHIFGPLLARSLSIQFTGLYMNNEFRDMLSDVQVGKFTKMDINHHLQAGFKAIFSQEYVDVTETVRKTCGGAGFASYSGFTQLYVNHVPIPTYEGDNTVMLL